MRFVAVFLRSFTSAIPAGMVKLRVQIGFFGEPYDEMAAVMKDPFDFGRRFLLEHLPLVFIEHLTLNDFFAHHERDDGLPKFVLFKEVLVEFLSYFALVRKPDYQSMPVLVDIR